MNVNIKAISVLCVVMFLVSAAVLGQVHNPAHGPGPKMIDLGVLNGRATYLPRAVYPSDARRMKIAGTVKVRVEIDVAGKVTSAAAISGPKHVSMRRSAEAAAMRAKFLPQTDNGLKVKVTGTISFTFDPTKYGREEMLKVLGISTFVSVARHFTADADVAKQPFGPAFFAKGGEEYPEFANEFESLSSLPKLTPEKRIETIDAALASVRAKLPVEERWQFETGRSLGSVIGPLMLALRTTGDMKQVSTADDAAIKLNLKKIKGSIATAPKNFPADVLQKLQDLSQMESRPDLLANKNIEAFFAKIEALLETLSPNAKE